jgi:hypothetical protein
MSSDIAHWWSGLLDGFSCPLATRYRSIDSGGHDHLDEVAR